LGQEGLEKLVEDFGQPRYRAKQISDALLHGAHSIDDLSTVRYLGIFPFLPRPFFILSSTGFFLFFSLFCSNTTKIVKLAEWKR
jgi:hypothetical protein